MRKMRARAFALRDVFPDVLRGMPVAEELFDTPENVIDPSTGEITPAASPARQELGPYPESDFAANLPSWRGVIESGRKTPDELIAMVSTKGVLSEAQKKAIQKLAPIEATDVAPKTEQAAPVDDQFVRDMG
jgi:hypothetical protein